MRLRRIKGTEEKLYAYTDYVIENPSELKGKWSEYFANDNPIYIELGCGKGNFITQNALRNKNVNYIAMEKAAEVIIKAVQKADNLKLDNVKFCHFNVNDILDVFEENELSRIFINFCDPWHKKRHYKRRLTYRGYLEMYKDILNDDGWLHFKTDNNPLFEFSLNEFVDTNLKIRNISLDLHKEENDWNIMTEYEAKFHSKGMPIYRCEIKF
ncbi:MAG: tRNA (guanosine(46)-N7)-methyltransferase TrmB [Firmicutes bacterium]|jgi:tRNA (guanine-N7-)-methyltransferase|nr:tRNA (guanosine(46)-N7)-methyltransferase TrmB [Bacillota bacterium]